RSSRLPPAISFIRPRHPSSPRFPYTTLFRSPRLQALSGSVALSTNLNLTFSAAGNLETLALDQAAFEGSGVVPEDFLPEGMRYRDRKSTRLNSGHVKISYAVFCLKKKNTFTP